MIVWITLSKLAGHLGQRLRAGDADADRHSSPAPNLSGKGFAPCLVVHRHIRRFIQHQEGLVNTVDEDIGSSSAEDVHHAARHIAVEGIVAAQRVNLLPGEAFGQLEEGQAFGYAYRLSLLTAGYDTTVVVRENHDSLAFESGVEDSFARDITVVTIDQCVEHSEDKGSEI